MIKWGHIQQIRRPRQAYRQAPPIVFNGFPHGLNTRVQADQIAITEAAELINFKIHRDGRLETRPPIKVYTSDATTSNAKVIDYVKAVISGTDREIVADENGKLYYLNGSQAHQSITGTLLSGDVHLLPFKDVVLVFDGLRLKYLDGVTAIKMAYDDGSGTSGYQFDNTAGSQDTTLALGNGTNTRIAYKFTSQAWDAGFTMPPTTFEVYLSKTGTPSASAITARLRKVSDDSILAEKTLVADATSLTGSAAAYSVTFASGDITTEMDPSTAYYMSIEHTGGDGSNHVNVHCTTVAGQDIAYAYSGSWAVSATHQPIASLKPGMPPKASFGVVHNGRPWLFGDPDNPGYGWFGNLTHLDFSTSDGGGYVGVIDSANNSFPVGGAVSIYGDLFVFGKEDAPYIAKLSGSTPSGYSLSGLYQKSWCTDRTMAHAVNDVWFGSKDGVDALSGVQEYGDLRTYSYSDPVGDRIKAYWDSATICEYYGDDGQFWMSFPGYYRVLVCHTKNPAVLANKARYPWTEYELTRDIYTDTDTYKWTASASGSNEYYLELAAGGDPSLNTPDAVLLNGIGITEGTAGALNDHEWDYGDNDSLGWNTIYFADATGDPDSSGIDLRSVIIPSMLRNSGGIMAIGTSDGYIYKIDESEYKDHGSMHMRCGLRTMYINTMDAIEVQRQSIMASGLMGGKLNLNFYTGRNFLTPNLTITHNLPVDDRLTVADLTMDVEDMFFIIDPTSADLTTWRTIDGKYIQVGVDEVYVSGAPMFISRIELGAKPLGV